MAQSSRRLERLCKLRRAALELVFQTPDALGLLLYQRFHFAEPVIRGVFDRCSVGVSHGAGVSFLNPVSLIAFAIISLMRRLFSRARRIAASRAHRSLQ